MPSNPPTAPLNTLTIEKMFAPNSVGKYDPIIEPKHIPKIIIFLSISIILLIYLEYQ